METLPRSKLRSVRAGCSEAGESISWTPQRAFSRLLNRLSRGDLSCYEALLWLQERNCPEAEAQEAVRMAQEARYLDDERHAQNLVEKARRVGWSRRRLQQELIRRQLSPQELDEGPVCEDLARRWLGRGVDPNKVTARLQRRGFRFAAIRDALPPSQEESEETGSRSQRSG